VTIEYVQWIETDESKHHAHLPPLCTTTRVWLRINPPARAWRNEVTDSGSWSLDIIDERGQFHTASSWKVCSLYPAIRPAINSEALMREALAPEVQMSETNRPADPRQRWVVSEGNLKGKKIRRYDRQIIRSNFLLIYVTWADPETRWLIRKEKKEIDLASGRQVQFTVYDRYVYNRRPPARTFKMPKGKRIVKREIPDQSSAEWSSMPEKDKRKILAVIDRLDQGWRDSNFRRFASAWKFDSVPKTPSANEWKRLLQDNRQVWSEWNQKVRSVRTTDVVVRRIGSSTYTWGPKRRKTLEIEMELHATHATTGKSWRGRAELFIQLRSLKRGLLSTRGYRVVHWDLPLQEIRAAVDIAYRVPSHGII
jgi:hypothetical protein